ncbi:MAG: 2,3-cyclic 3-phosphodiesterase [Pyrinomonadaceae bacterium]|jgi:2'-5' RNA ligase|nr:2,3-cyclic 3-phosphodiesterase [Pyrinomonadaceae bacterium]
MSDLEPKRRLRIFCALELPEDVRARVAAHVAHLRAAAESSLKISWERAEKLHLTLKFLGEVEAGRVESLARAAKRVAEGTCKFEVSLGESGAFPPRGNPRVLWLGLQDATGLLARLQARLEAECERENFPRDARPFRPHITIARIRAANAAARHVAALHRETEFAPAIFDVGDFVIMQSQLGTDGSRYTTLSRHELKAGTGG